MNTVVTEQRYGYFTFPQVLSYSLCLCRMAQAMLGAAGVSQVCAVFCLQWCNWHAEISP